MLISSRYSGNSQMAFFRWLSSVFSTTITWNCRGRQTTVSMARNVNGTHWPPTMPAPCSSASLGSAAAWRNRSPKPSNRP